MRCPVRTGWKSHPGIEQQHDWEQLRGLRTGDTEGTAKAPGRQEREWSNPARPLSRTSRSDVRRAAGNRREGVSPHLPRKWESRGRSQGPMRERWTAHAASAHDAIRSAHSRASTLSEEQVRYYQRIASLRGRHRKIDGSPGEYCCFDRSIRSRSTGAFSPSHSAFWLWNGGQFRGAHSAGVET